MELFIAAGHWRKIVLMNGNVHISVDVIVARSIEEAEGFLLRTLKEKYPPTDGWIDHQAFVFPAPIEKLTHFICEDGRFDNSQPPFYISID